MKQLYAISSFLCLAALLAASCTTSLTDEPDTTARAIAFSTPQARTRAAVNGTSLTSGSFSVWGWYGEDGANSHNVFDGEKVTGVNSVWTYDGTRYWIPGKTYNFYAVHPATLPAGTTADVSSDGTITVTDFDCSATGGAAVDLMTATAPGSGDNPEKVAMEFQHELAKVKFIVVSEGDAITLTNAKLYGVSHKGSLNGKIWTPDAVDDTPFQTSSLEIADTQEHPLFGGDLLLIPHNSLDGATLTFVYHYSGETETHSVSSALNAVGTVIAWEAGQSYNYRISIPRNAVDVMLEVTVNNWEEENYTVEW